MRIFGHLQKAITFALETPEKNQISIYPRIKNQNQQPRGVRNSNLIGKGGGGQKYPTLPFFRNISKTIY